MNLAEVVLAQARRSSDSIAIRLLDDVLTYAGLAAESERVARGLRDLGVSRGHRVMLFADNSVEHFVIYLAVARLGAIFVPIHPSFQSVELEYVLANCEPTVIVAEEQLWERLERTERIAVTTSRVVLDRPHGELMMFANLGHSTSTTVGIESVDPHDAVLICYTSGTTDRPNPVTRSHANEIWNAKSYAEVWDYRPSDRALVALPLSWVWALSTLGQALLTEGATILLHREFDAADILDEIEDSEVTLFAGTMSMYTAILGELDHRERNLSSLRHLYRGGEPINNETVDALNRRIGVALTDAYATTEAAPVLAVDPQYPGEVPRGTVGRLVRDARIRIVDDSGIDVVPGEVGEAWLGGPGVMLGYWNEPELTTTRMVHGDWFRSGDLMVQDDNGFFFIIGRMADIIIRNGAKIAPAEVEAAIATLPGVADSVAVGIPDQEFGENIVAYVQLNPDCIVTADDIYDHLSDRIARFKLPSHINLVSELPVRRNEKRDRAAILSGALDSVRLDSTETTALQQSAPKRGAHLRIVP